MLATDGSAIVRVQQIPYENEGIVTARGKHAAPRRIPFYAVDGSRVTAQFEEGLAGLPDVEDADKV